MASTPQKFRTLLTGEDGDLEATHDGDAAHGHSDAGHAHGAHAIHVVPMWLLCLIFGILLVLTIATVAVYQFNFGYKVNLGIALGIAVVKAGLVAMYFMHLRWDNPFNGLVFITALIFVALFIGGTVQDTTNYNPNFKQTANTPQNP